jgi:hypothetical protein
VQALDRLLGDAELRASLGPEALERARSEFSFEAVAAATAARTMEAADPLPRTCTLRQRRGFLLDADVALPEAARRLRSFVLRVEPVPTPS